jgi:hypothetical protein
MNKLKSKKQAKQKRNEETHQFIFIFSTINNESKEVKNDPKTDKNIDKFKSLKTKYIFGRTSKPKAAGIDLILESKSYLISKFVT